MNKKMFIICVLLSFVIILQGCEPVTEQNRDTIYSNENKFCKANNMYLNDTYYVNRCQMVACANSTGISTYRFCNNQDTSEGFTNGILVGYLLFGR